MDKHGFVYMMASRRNGTVYIGSTSNLVQRVYQHRHGLVEGFTRQHGCKLLVWYQDFDQLEEARRRELQMKKWKRSWKLSTIEMHNPDWADLYPRLFG